MTGVQTCALPISSRSGAKESPATRSNAPDPLASAPPPLSDEKIAKLNATMVQVLASPPVKERFEELGIEISALDRQSPEALRIYQKQEAERWWPIIKAAGIKVE